MTSNQQISVEIKHGQEQRC